MTLREIGKAIRVRREELGLTQGDLGAKVGYTRSGLGNVENGHNEIPIGKFLEICQALRTTPDGLLFGTQNPINRLELEHILTQGLNIIRGIEDSGTEERKTA